MPEEDVLVDAANGDAIDAATNGNVLDEYGDVIGEGTVLDVCPFLKVNVFFQKCSRMETKSLNEATCSWLAVAMRIYWKMQMSRDWTAAT